MQEIPANKYNDYNMDSCNLWNLNMSQRKYSNAYAIMRGNQSLSFQHSQPVHEEGRNYTMFFSV